ncbi:unnamed protein product [Porites lobata]|uniref:VWFC domain-containing protein n=1 Tax=Porites lobata TaxID=104759 RepID=A0ABN8NWB7_9CNID|nr:unnamed protein product [Porites lobata]
MRCQLVIFFSALSIAVHGRSFYTRGREKRCGTCQANGKTYQDGDTIIYHNVTTPIESASCTQCDCSAGSINNCYFYYCDIGLGSFLIDGCERWSVGVEGVCCPKCECVSNGQQMSVGDSWIRRTTPDVCYECSCSESAAAECYQIQCLPCDGVTVTVPGRCCPRCDPVTTTTTATQVFTIVLTTPRRPPVFPEFPWGDEGVDYEDMNDNQ